MAAALEGTARCEVVLVNKTRTVDDFGFFVKDDGRTCFFMASVLPKDFESLKVNEDGSVGVNDFNIYADGRISIELNDKVRINEVVFKVRELVFRPEGGFTKIRVRSIRRRATT